MDPTFIRPVHIRLAIWMLSMCNAVSLIVAANLVLWMKPEDRISAKRGSALTALGLVYFTSLFELFNTCALFSATGARVCRKYKLTVGDVLDITNKLVSAVQAALSCVTGAVVCLYSCTRDFMRTSHYMSEAYAWFGAAYFFYDIWSMYMVHVQMNINPGSKKGKGQLKQCKNGTASLSSGDTDPGQVEPAEAPPAALDPAPVSKIKEKTSFLSYCRHEPVILLHHLFIGGFGFLVIVYFRGELGDCTFGFVYLMELSTPFVSVRGILSRMQMKASRAYVANGLLMLFTFFICRVISLPYVCLLYSREIDLPYFQAIKTLPTGCKISICILLLPQLYWFYLMSTGALKMLLSGKSSHKSDNKLSAGDGTEDPGKRS